MSVFLLEDMTRIEVRVIEDVGGLKTVTVSVNGGEPVSITEFTKSRQLLGLWARVIKRAPYVELRRYIAWCLRALDDERWESACRAERFDQPLGHFWPSKA